MPFRAFSDVEYDWKIVCKPCDYMTPPYITAELVMSQHKLVEGDKFLILALMVCGRE
jgi:hypothetical protein